MMARSRRGLSVKLSEHPDPWVEIACDHCPRRGRLRTDRLIEKYGPDITMPDLRHLIANCPRRGQVDKPCGVHYVKRDG